MIAGFWYMVTKLLREDRGIRARRNPAGGKVKARSISDAVPRVTASPRPGIGISRLVVG
jgi:hypothetical protein